MVRFTEERSRLLGFGYGRSRFSSCRSVRRRDSEGVWWLDLALSSGSSSGVTYWRSLFVVEWSLLAFLEFRLGVLFQLQVVFLLRGDDGGVPSAPHMEACWSCGQGFLVVLRVRSLEVPASSVVYGRLRCVFHDALRLLVRFTY
ncbi:Uncharacterized protein Rs2_31021 [Raphanus sativus]|nr:Uncharacterized protein Rs2_31021 [Raphanus sativus]